MKKASKRVIPGFGLSMGVTLSILSVIVLIPLASLVVYTAQMNIGDIIATITRKRVLVSFGVRFSTALIASLINAVMGVILAWVLVRYKFPLKRLLDGMIELQFALPTAVSVLSGHLRGKTNTLPLHVEILFNEFKYVPAFAVSSILVVMAIVIPVIRSIVENIGKAESEDVR